jgi:hypothetical protein
MKTKLHIFLISEGDGGLCGYIMVHALVAFLPGKGVHSIHSIEGWVGPTYCQDTVETKPYLC